MALFSQRRARTDNDNDDDDDGVYQTVDLYLFKPSSYFDLFLLIWTSFVLRAKDIV